jgi:hypothetical protein
MAQNGSQATDDLPEVVADAGQWVVVDGPPLQDVVDGLPLPESEVARHAAGLIQGAPEFPPEGTTWPDLDRTLDNPLWRIRIVWLFLPGDERNRHRILVYSLYGQLCLIPAFRVPDIGRRQRRIIAMLDQIQLWMTANPALSDRLVQRHMYELIDLAHDIVEPPSNHSRQENPPFSTTEIRNRQRIVLRAIEEFKLENHIDFDDYGIPLIPQPNGGHLTNGLSGDHGPYLTNGVSGEHLSNGINGDHDGYLTNGLSGGHLSNSVNGTHDGHLSNGINGNHDSQLANGT